MASDFERLTSHCLFYASEHNPFRLVIKHDVRQQQLESFPLLKTCNACSELFTTSKIVSTVGAIEWEHVATSTFDPNSLVSLFFCTKYKLCASCIGEEPNTIRVVHLRWQY